MKKIAILMVFVSFAMGVFGMRDVFAQEATPSDDEVNAIAKEMYCPVCENIPLDVCGTTACAQWRELIREKLSLGWSPEQIKTYFAEQYGDRVLAEPPPRGFNWLAYILPPVAILVGVYILYRTLQAWHKPVPQAPILHTESGDTLEDEYIARLEEELHKRA
ncbi:MAG: cytochrome c-type biogenesis protein CcmH [Chloroflexota bacterium]